MIHPYFLLATVVVGVAVTAYVVYNTVYQEEPLYIYVGEGSEKRNEPPRENCSDNGDEDSLVDSDEQSGLRKRKKSKGSSPSVRRHSDYDEQELLDRLSYLTAVEQEIERKKHQLANEERILGEKEREIEQRKQNLLSISHSSSISELRDSSVGTTLQNNSATSTLTNNTMKIHHEQPLAEVPSPISPTFRPPSSAKTINSPLNDEHDNESHTFSDTAAHNILTQDLSHISHQQMTPVANYPLTMNHHSNSTISSHLGQDDTIKQSDLTTKSARSEDTWSEIESILSENIGSIMSSAVDIDMEEVDVIEH